MHLEYADSRLDAVFAFTDYLQRDERLLSKPESVIRFLWNRNDRPAAFQLDGRRIELDPHQIVTTTYFQHLGYLPEHPPLTALVFNREFYCIVDHDKEVGCNGILFFGTQDLPVITIPEDQRLKFDRLIDTVLDEFQTQDTIQGDMLQMLLKRFIIMCTRLAKEQRIVHNLDDGQIDTIRQFNVLVDMHFREKQSVREYAELLYKSPKTLSNLFATYNQKTPKQIIQERIALEAKRLLHFTDKQTQEIAYELGFDDPGYFSRFFKKIVGESPSAYKRELGVG